MPGVYLYSDWSEIDRELDRLSKMPDPETVALLDAGLAELFGFSQSVVDVVTGSLKGSGRKSSQVDRAGHTWQGEITYGGNSTGVNNPVDYAWYEQRRNGSHDFMKPVVMLSDEVLGTAVQKGVS
jgi:hypothetical protein